MNTINLFGAPGSGKGTQGQYIAEWFGYAHISTGNLLRKYKNGTDPLSVQITETINSGNLVSDELLFQLLEKELKEIGNDLFGVVLDGVPRNANQVHLLNNLLKELGLNPDDTLNLLIKVDEEEVVKRLLLRAEIEGRADDNIDTIKKRMAIFKEQMEEMKPLLQFIEVDGGNKTPKEVYAEIERIIELFFVESL